MASDQNQLNYWFGSPAPEMRVTQAGGGPGRIPANQMLENIRTPSAAGMTGEILPPERPVAVRAIEGPSDAHPAWATSYMPGGQIVYSRGNIALREGIRKDGTPYYTGVKNFGDNVGGTAYDIRMHSPKSQTFNQTEAQELGDVANRLEKKFRFIEGR